jgi:hypothetical protein
MDRWSSFVLDFFLKYTPQLAWYGLVHESVWFGA